MPIRIASLARQLHKNGQRLHIAIASRAFSHGSDQTASKAAKPPKEKAAKSNKPSRADKQTKKAENLEAAKKADRKSAKT